MYPFPSTFFSLTPKAASEYRFQLFSNIHDVVFHGNGGFSWDMVYNMPIWLRKFTWNKIVDNHNKQMESTSKSQNEIDISNPIKSNIPKEVLQPKQKPNYVTKASKK